VICTLFIHGHIFTFKHLCLHSITKILRNGPKAHFPFRVGPAGQRGRRRGASAGGRAGNGPRGPDGERGALGRGEKVGPETAQPRGVFPFFFFYFHFLFLFLFLLSPFSFEQIFSYIFLSAKNIYSM
jgi:hypothetical protein